MLTVLRDCTWNSKKGARAILSVLSWREFSSAARTSNSKRGTRHVKRTVLAHFLGESSPPHDSYFAQQKRGHVMRTMSRWRGKRKHVSRQRRAINSTEDPTTRPCLPHEPTHLTLDKMDSTCKWKIEGPSAVVGAHCADSHRQGSQGAPRDARSPTCVLGAQGRANPTCVLGGTRPEAVQDGGGRLASLLASGLVGGLEGEVDGRWEGEGEGEGRGEMATPVGRGLVACVRSTGEAEW